MLQLGYKVKRETSETMEGYVISESPWSLTEHGRKAEIKLKSNIYELEAWSVLIREAQVS